MKASGFRFSPFPPVLRQRQQPAAPVSGASGTKGEWRGARRYSLTCTGRPSEAGALKKRLKARFDFSTPGMLQALKMVALCVYWLSVKRRLIPKLVFELGNWLEMNGVFMMRSKNRRTVTR